MDKQIVFTKINTAELLDVEQLPVGDYDVKVKTHFSTISCGTERANITGNTNVSINPKTSDVAEFPRYTGYSSSGIVVEKGKLVTNVEIGDKVAMCWSLHRGYNVLNEKNVIKIDEGIPMDLAAISNIATFPLAAIRKTRVEIGESALVMGLGILGLLGVVLLRASGATPIIAADPVEQRRKKALELGADFALDPFDKDFADKVKSITQGGANAAIEVTGHGSGLNGALDCMAKFGRIALLGCTRESDFTVDYYRKVHGPGITLIGAHTLARPEFESHSGWFTGRDDAKTFLKLIKSGRINIQTLTEETHCPIDCEKVYERLVNDKNFPVVVQFDWREV